MLHWWAVATVMVLVGVTGIAYGLTRPAAGPNITKPIGVTSLQSFSVFDHHSSSHTTAMASIANVTGTSSVRTVSNSTGGTPAPTARLRHVVPLTIRSRPVHITIPSLGVSAPVSVLGLNHDGSPQVPTNFYVPGWYKFGPTPGQRGSAVILGHVDSFKGPAVFFHLVDLKIGSPIIVTLADRTVVRFDVIGLREYSKGHFPDRVVYGRRSYSAMQLVTCGGTFDRATGHYESNIVAYTALVSKSVPRRHRS